MQKGSGNKKKRTKSGECGFQEIQKNRKNPNNKRIILSTS